MHRWAILTIAVGALAAAPAQASIARHCACASCAASLDTRGS
jgi:hypothetical protein